MNDPRSVLAGEVAAGLVYLRRLHRNRHHTPPGLPFALWRYALHVVLAYTERLATWCSTGKGGPGPC